MIRPQLSSNKVLIIHFIIDVYMDCPQSRYCCHCIIFEDFEKYTSGTHYTPTSCSQPSGHSGQQVNYYIRCAKKLSSQKSDGATVDSELWNSWPLHVRPAQLSTFYSLLHSSVQYTVIFLHSTIQQADIFIGWGKEPQRKGASQDRAHWCPQKMTETTREDT